MTVKLADTIFSTKPIEDLLVADVYEVEDGGVKSKVADLIEKSGSKLSLSTNTKNMAKNLSGLVDIKNGKLKFDPSMLKGRLDDIKGNIKGTLRTLGPAQLDNILGQYGTSIDGLKDIRVGVKGIIKDFDPKQFTTIKGITGLLSGVVGVDDVISYFDLEAEYALFSGIVDEVIGLGFPEAVGSILDALKDNASDPEIMQGVVRKNLPGIIATGDLDAILSAISISGVEALLSTQPNMLEETVRRYRHPRDLDKSKLPQQATKFVGLLDSLRGDWSYTYRDGVKTSDLTIYAMASGDSIELFSLIEEHVVPSLIAGKYREESIINLAKRNFRYTAI